MNPGLVVKLRPSGPWRIGPDSGARNRVDVIYHSDSLYSAVTAAMSRLGWLEEWLDATARTSSPAVSFSSCFPFLGDIVFVIPPRTVWPPAAHSTKSARVRWKSARFVPLTVVQSILAGQRLDENQWSIDGPSDCLVPAGRPGPFRTAVRSSAGIDRLTGTSERHSTACIEFRPGSGLWTVVSFADHAAQEQWSAKVKAAFRLLADTGFGGERSRGWGRSEAPEFIDGMLPDLILLLPTESAKAAVEPAEGAEAAVIATAQVAPLVVKKGEEASAADASTAETETPVVAEPGAEPPQPVTEAALETPAAAEVAAEPEPPVAESTATEIETPVAVEPAAEFAQPATVAASETPAAVEPIAELAPPATEAAPEPAAAAEPVAESEPSLLEAAAAAIETPAAGEPVAVPEQSATEATATEIETPAAAEPVAEPEPSKGEAAAPEPEHQPAAVEAPVVVSTTPTHPHWLLSLFTPAAADSVDWRRGNYTVLPRGGRVDSPAGSGELKKQIQMVAEGSVVYAETAPRGSAADVAPDGFAHPVFRAGFAVAIPLPEVR
jgi:CRISPR type III-A-associated RAMP protein Csm4